MMKASVILVGVGAFVIALMILFPPYFVIDSQSNGRVHGPIGYHPIWKPPTSEYGYLRVHSKDYEGQSVPEISKERLESYKIRVNRVGLTIQSIVVVLLVSIGVAVMERRQRRSNTRMQQTAVSITRAAGHPARRPTEDGGRGRR